MRRVLGEQLGRHVAGGAALGLHGRMEWLVGVVGVVTAAGWLAGRSLGPRDCLAPLGLLTAMREGTHTHNSNKHRQGSRRAGRTGGKDCSGVLLMSDRRRDRPNPPSFSRPFSSSRMLEGFRSQ